MLFNSYEFIFVFLPFAFLFYFYLSKKISGDSSRIFLLLASLFFYSWWNIVYLPIILASMIFNYAIGLGVSKSADTIKYNQKHLLIFGIVANILLLGYFKYSDFFIANINALMGSDFNLLHLVLPLAISFFTFQQIAYLVDSYKGRVKEHHFLNYALFVTFFPQLIAGPIVHHKQMMPQFSLNDNRALNYENIAKGIFIFSIGLFKKVVIADTFALWANYGFSDPDVLNMIEAWVASLSFGFQLYFDFSGYTDMAIGLALLFNIKLPVNFRSPYKALDIQDFWRRWHITLSHFLRDYISLPLKKRGVNLHVNILLTFLLSGIWHGAGWTFVIWGLLHGAALIVHDFWKRWGFNMPIVMAWLITFNFLNITRVFFRAENSTDALHILHVMLFGPIVLPLGVQNVLGFLTRYGVTFGDYLLHLHTNRWALIALFMAFVMILLFKSSSELTEQMHSNKKNMLFAAFLLLVGLTYLDREIQFYYFIF
jgi:D-alanyl-lipoteichoic acid acyltransferase DltB (MBOAT superfamily)